MKYVLLNDNNEGCVLIGCVDQETAEQVGRAAIFSDGDVSAWLVPTVCITQVGEVIEVLRNNGGIAEVCEVSVPETPVRIGRVDVDRIQELEAGIRLIVDSWEGGDLAGAVNEAAGLLSDEEV